MARIKRTFECIACKKIYFKWIGLCLSCGKGGTIKETTVTLTKESRDTDRARRVRRRSKDSERALAKRMATIDGEDPAFDRVASKHGRIGFITNIRADSVSSNYIHENKNRPLPKWLADAWLLILTKGIEFNKHALLHIDPPNLPKEYLFQGIKRKTDSIAMIQQSRHEDLIIAERNFKLIKEIMDSNESNLIRIRKIREILG